MATFLLFLCIAAGCGVLGILFMLYGPTHSSVLRVRASAAPVLAVSFAPPPPRFDSAAPIAPASAPPFVPIAHSLSTDFSIEEPVQEVRIRAKAPSPPPLPPVTPMPPPPVATRSASIAPPPLPAATRSASLAPPFPKAAAPAAQTIAPAAPLRAEATPTTPPRLGVSAPSARARHLEPPRRIPAPLPRSRSARGSDAPPVPSFGSARGSDAPVSSFATDRQRTVPRELEDLSTAEHTFVD